MLIEFTPPAATFDGRALRLLNLAADELFGKIDGHSWLGRVELPKDPPMAPHRANAPSASRNSAQVMAPRAGSQAREILHVLDATGRPMTAADITGVLGMAGARMSRNQVAARLWSLRNGGWIEYVKHEGDMLATSDAEGYVIESTSLAPGGAHFARVQRLTVKAVRMLEANRETQQ